jgi:phosphopantetheinyl transferase
MNVKLAGPICVAPECRLWLGESLEPELASRELEDDAALAQLTPQERLRWAKYRPIEKKRQFLQSRIAVKRVLAREFGQAAEEPEFTAAPSGRPLLLDSAGNPVRHISLSHSQAIIAIAIAAADVGVDVEAVQKLQSGALKIHGIQNDEIGLLHNSGRLSRDDSPTAVWAIKEAVWKCIGGPVMITAEHISIEEKGGRLLARILSPELSGEEISLHVFESHPSIGLKGFGCEHQSDAEGFSTAFVGCVAQRAR